MPRSSDAMWNEHWHESRPRLLLQVAALAMQALLTCLHVHTVGIQSTLCFQGVEPQGCVTVYL